MPTVEMLELFEKLQEHPVLQTIVRDYTPPRDNLIGGPEDAVAHFREGIGSYNDKERLYAMALDMRHRVLATEVITEGSDSYTVVDPRQVFRWALQHGAKGIVLVHNHPSGNPALSPQDLEVGKRLHAASKLLALPILDFLTITPTAWESMAQQGHLPSFQCSPQMWTN